MKLFLKNVVVEGWRASRAFWPVVGVCVLVVAIGEGSYRMLGSFKRALRAVSADPATQPEVHDPQAGTDWYDGYRREFDAASRMQWRPYVYFRRPPTAGRYVTIDSLGHRVTQLERAPGVPVARVFFFGGSTMWGTGQRNEHTIPAEASRRLQAMAGIGGPVEVTNFGESGYVFTQELLELLLQLRAGNHPDIVVFYDGINDVAAALQSGVPGIPQNEAKRAGEFAMGRALDHGGSGEGLGADLRAFGVLAVASLHQLQLGRRLEELVAHRAHSLLPADSAARGIARVYAENVRIIESLSHAYHFTPIYVWQPTLYATEKRLTAYEQQLMRRIQVEPFERRSYLGPIQRAWMGLAHVISRVTTPLFMGIVYFAVVTPIGFVRRLVGESPFAERERTATRWAPHTPVPPVREEMERQF